MSNIKALPNNGFAPENEAIAKHLREMAEWVESGVYGDVRNVFLVIEPVAGDLVRQLCGQPCDLAREVGVLQVAITRIAMGDM